MEDLEEDVEDWNADCGLRLLVSLFSRRSSKVKGLRQ